MKDIQLFSNGTKNPIALIGTIMPHEVFELPTGMVTIAAQPSQEDLKRKYDRIREQDDSLVVNFNKQTLADGLTKNGKLKKAPIIAMNLIIRVGCTAYCVDADVSEMDELPIIVHANPETGIVLKIKKTDTNAIYCVPDSVYALLLCGHKGKYGDVTSCDIAYLLASDASAERCAFSAAVMQPNCEAPYEIINSTKDLYRTLGKEVKNNGNVSQRPLRTEEDIDC